jgi:hypothetical protein
LVAYWKLVIGMCYLLDHRLMLGRCAPSPLLSGTTVVGFQQAATLGRARLCAVSSPGTALLYVVI